MDSPFSVGTNKYTKNVAGFGGPLPPVPAKENKVSHDLLQKAGSTNETHSNHGADAHSRCRRRLRTTDPVKMTFSGDAGPSAIDLKQPNTNTDEENLAGNGTLGPFTFRLVRASATAPQPSSTCSGPTKLYFPNVAGAGLFRFQDGSLLKVNLTQGGDCIDFAAKEAHCTLTFKSPAEPAVSRMRPASLRLPRRRCQYWPTPLTIPSFLPIPGSLRERFPESAGSKARKSKAPAKSNKNRVDRRDVHPGPSRLSRGFVPSRVFGAVSRARKNIFGNYGALC